MDLIEKLTKKGFAGPPTAKAAAIGGCDDGGKKPFVPIGLKMYSDVDGTSAITTDQVPPNTTVYLITTMSIDFHGQDLYLANALGSGVTNDPDSLAVLRVVSWKSNGIRDENLLSSSGVPAIAFEAGALRRFGFNVTPTNATQKITVAIFNPDATTTHGVQGLIAGICGVGRDPQPCNA